MSFYFEKLQHMPRKKKRCYWCNEWCEVLRPRFRVVGMWEGDFFASHFHPECQAARDKWQKQHANFDPNELPDEGQMKRGETIYQEEIWV